MNTLKTELENLFADYPKLQVEYSDINHLNEKMLDYFKEVVSTKNDYINPYFLARTLKYTNTQTITLLLLLSLFSKKKTVSAEYIFTSDCEIEHYVSEDELENFKCLECGRVYNIKKDLMEGNYTLPIRFKLDQEIIQEIKSLFSTLQAKGDGRFYPNTAFISEVGLEIINESIASNVQIRQPVLANSFIPSGKRSLLEMKLRGIKKKSRVEQ